jgi:hydrogenase large subunit
MRRKAHTMSARFSGRHPIQNAIVPGGVTTLFNKTDVDDFRSELTAIRNFINKYYIPDVLFVATRTNIATTSGGTDNWMKYWGVGTNPGLVLSYGEYPDSGEPFSNGYTGGMLLSRGVVGYAATTQPFDTASIAEYVGYSYYSSPSGLHPSAGVTTPDVSLVEAGGDQYSWLKAPRWNGNAAEVGPLARMLATYVLNGSATAPNTGTFDMGSIVSGMSLGAEYTVTNLVVATLDAANVGVANLWSPLGRHACRALECKLVADKMDTWLSQLSYDDWQAGTHNGSSYDEYTTTNNVGSGYVYKDIPRKLILYGEGLAEAPRGALGHWIKINDRTIANYQCVVPSTWNACPRSTSSELGPAEQAMQNINAATTNNLNDAIVNIARMLHPYDFCIACAVHVVTPDRKEVAKFKMDLDGGVKKL